MSEGKNPGVEHLTRLGQEAKITNVRIDEIIDQTKQALAEWSCLAKEYNVSQANLDLIGMMIGRNL